MVKIMMSNGDRGLYRTDACENGEREVVALQNEELHLSPLLYRRGLWELRH